MRFAAKAAEREDHPLFRAVESLFLVGQVEELLIPGFREVACNHLGTQPVATKPLRISRHHDVEWSLLAQCRIDQSC